MCHRAPTQFLNKEKSMKQLEELSLLRLGWNIILIHTLSRDDEDANENGT